MAYAMESYLFDVSETYENANWDCIIDALLTLASYADCEPSADYGFVIVKTDTPKENCVMIQTAKDYGKKKSRWKSGMNIKIKKIFGNMHGTPQILMPCCSIFMTLLEGNRWMCPNLKISHNSCNK